MRQGVIHVVRMEAKPGGEQPQVEVMDEALWSAADMRSAVLAGAQHRKNQHQHTAQHRTHPEAQPRPLVQHPGCNGSGG